MDEKEMQAQFIQWLAQKTGVKSEQELTEVIKKLQSTEGAMEQTIQEFKTAMSGEQPTFKLGGKVDYIECLSKLKKGGKMDCGCGAKMPKVQKAFLGAALGALKGASSIISGGTGILKGATTVAKGAKTLATINKVAGYGQQALNIGKNIMGGMQPTANTAQGTQLNTTPPANPVTGAPPATVLNTRVTPTLQPMGTQARQPGMPLMKTIAPKLIAEKGAKLKAKPEGKKSVPLMKK